MPVSPTTPAAPAEFPRRAVRDYVTMQTVIMKEDASALRNAVTVVGVCLAIAASAALRQHYSDPEIVSRADLIVVGKMKEGSLALIFQ